MVAERVVLSLPEKSPPAQETTVCVPVGDTLGEGKSVLGGGRVPVVVMVSGLVGELAAEPARVWGCIERPVAVGWKRWNWTLRVLTRGCAMWRRSSSVSCRR